jgi:hypothetical protein
MSNLKLQALKANYTAKRLEAIATLDVYFNASVGIGEHPQIIEEMDKLVRQIADAEGCLQVLEENFIEKPEQV